MALLKGIDDAYLLLLAASTQPITSLFAGSDKSWFAGRTSLAGLTDDKIDHLICIAAATMQVIC